MKVSHNWLQRFFTDTLPDPEDIEAKLGEHIFEPEGMEVFLNDTVIDFDVLPNRAHDCLSHYGIAREVSALFDLPLLDQIIAPYQNINDSLHFSAEITENTPCNRHVGRVISGLQVGPSPDWLRESLEVLGQRSINNIVDTTNYVMLHLGQPNHVFDWVKFSGDTLFIRNAQSGELLTTLDGTEYSLQDTDIVLADKEGSLDIAGIKGGLKAELDDKTTDVLISAAHFHPTTIRKTSRRINLLTDASKRFENEPSRELPPQAIAMVTKLLLEVAATESTRVGPIHDTYPNPQTLTPVSLTTTQVNTLLGTSLDTQQIIEILEKFSFGIEKQEKNLMVTPPHWRLDITIAEDLIEEVGRYIGYNNLSNPLPPEGNKPLAHPGFILKQKLRALLADHGLHEIYTYSFREEGAIQMQNGIASDKEFLRTNLHEGVQKAMTANTKNAHLFGATKLGVFEIGTVFPENNTDVERTHLIIMIDPLAKKARNKGTVDEIRTILKKVLGEEFTDSLITETTDLSIEINLSIYIAKKSEHPDSYENIWSPELEAFATKQFSAFSVFPFISRDISIGAPSNTSANEVQQILLEHAGDLQKNISLFDTYDNGEEIAYGFKIVFQADDRTLTDEEITPIMEAIEKAITQKSWRVR
ncbi:MAG: phenylalanyl-tRNA synthetase beta chain [Planctomycetota bacterium]|jgi:phenylalanyl-tRNA synthetase beta chain